MWLIAKLLLMVLLPLAWGLGSDWIFAKIRRGSPRKDTGGDFPV